MSSKPIVVFGTICLDRICRIPRLPKPGGYVEVESEIAALGGEAANTALSLIRFGEQVQLIGNPFGCDPEGDLLIELMFKARLQPHEQIIDKRTPVCDILITPDGERTMLGRGFAGLILDLDLQLANEAQWFTADPNFGKAAREAVRQAQSQGYKTYLMDFLQVPDIPLIEKCDVLQTSTDWAGERGNKEANLKWCEEHARHGCIAIITDAANGTYYATPSKPASHLSAFPAPQVTDATGAGDAFRAGMLHGLNQGWPLEESLLFASAAGALNTMNLGANAILPSVQEIEEFIANA